MAAVGRVSATSDSAIPPLDRGAQLRTRGSPLSSPLSSPTHAQLLVLQGAADVHGHRRRPGRWKGCGEVRGGQPRRNWRARACVRACRPLSAAPGHAGVLPRRAQRRSVGGFSGARAGRGRDVFFGREAWARAGTMPRQRPTRAPAAGKQPCVSGGGHHRAATHVRQQLASTRGRPPDTTPVCLGSTGGRGGAKPLFFSPPLNTNPFTHTQWLTYWVVYSLYGLVEGALRLTKW